ncbi:MAG: S8 family peptidase [Pseudomonadota bacterium]|nr:S8 family peptidase [Pseudomonadota bacterium]
MTFDCSRFGSWLRVMVLCAFSFALAESSAAAELRLIVKLKDDPVKAKVDLKARIARVSEDTGVTLSVDRPMALGMTLLRVQPGADARALATELSKHPDVEWAEPDQRQFALKISNDEFLSGQSYLSSDPNGIDAFGAWDITTGAPSTVVAVIDTGYRPHVDLGGRILPGYDFIHDPVIANDGDGRDADASDPGDWVSAADVATDAFKGCTRENSSWHGTAVSGIIAANTNNGMWVAGVDWQAKILPVRVLGKCGGLVSDIADSIAWAAGLPVPGVPNNPNPAQVINMSLGGTSPTCPTAYRNAIASALAAGNTKAIVVAAGNSTADVANHAPANCAGVIAVASTTTSGNLARYSDFGSGVTISAPGGQYQPSIGNDGIIVLSNNGTTSPGSDSFNIGGGTSFAAPMVSGVIALMLAVNPQLSGADVRSILASTAKAFPGSSTCDITRCGAGIVNAAGAVAAAKASAPVSTTVTVVEYYNATLDHYFITWVPGEMATLDAGITIKGWKRTGATFKVYAGAQSGTSPVCRYYLPPAYGDSHFFGRGTAECAQTGIQNPGFVLESADFMDVFLPVNGTCGTGTLPVYRVFSQRVDANHRYMVDRATRDAMVARGWLAEGDGPDRVVMCVPQ